MYQNTNIISRLEEILSDKYDHLGSDQPVNVDLWPKGGFWAAIASFFGPPPQEVLTVRFSPKSGYTLDGPSWKEIKTNLGCSAREFGHRIIAELRDIWEATHGWESALLEDLQSLEDL